MSTGTETERITSAQLSHLQQLQAEKREAEKLAVKDTLVVKTKMVPTEKYYINGTELTDEQHDEINRRKRCLADFGMPQGKADGEATKGFLSDFKVINGTFVPVGSSR